MNKHEDFNDLARDLALAVADALENQSTPAELRDLLNEAASQLIDLLAPSIPAHLRALAGLTQSSHSSAYPETKTPVLDRTDAILSRSDENSQAFAVSH